MESKKFFEALNDIDDNYLIESVAFRKQRKRKCFMVAACFAVAFVMCGFAYVNYSYYGAGLVGDVALNKITKPFETKYSTQMEELEPVSGKDLVQIDMISDYSNVFADEFACIVVEDGTIPATYFSPNHMIVFTQSENHGWELAAGEQLGLDFLLNRQQNLSLEVGYVFEGEYYEITNVQGNAFDEIINAEKDGEYYFCVTNRSSANAVIVSGDIK